MIIASGPEAVKVIVGEVVAPLLKAAGYKKSAMTWTKAFGETTAVFNVQSSSSNMSEEARFTINLGISHPAFHEERIGHAIRGPLKEYQCDLRERIGQLMYGQDHWWRLAAGADDGPVREEVASAISGAALPWLERHAQLDAMVERFVASSMWFDAAIGCHMLGRREAGRYVALAMKDASPYFVTTVRQWAMANGYRLEDGGGE